MTPVVIDPERQFLGCLMRLDTNPARRLLAGMRATDLADPIASDLIGLAIQLVAADHAPTPLALLDSAWETTDTRPWTGGPHRLQVTGSWIADTYHHAPPAPAASGPWLKTVVLKAAWRRAIRAHGQRLVHAVDEEWATTVLHEAADDTARVDDLWSRYRTAREQIGSEREAA
ncbi:hypothetical protein [Actinophytocola sediminis]